MPPVPVGEGLVRVLGEVSFVRAGGDLAPGRCVIEHNVVALRRFRERGVYSGGEGMNELRIVRVDDPERASADAAKVAARSALLAVYPGLVDGYVLLTLDLQGL